MREQEKSYSSKKTENTRVKVKPRKQTVGITIPPKLIKRIRKHKLNISRIAEQALNSILDYLETQNCQKSSDFLGKASFPTEGLVDGDSLVLSFKSVIVCLFLTPNYVKNSDFF